MMHLLADYRPFLDPLPIWARTWIWPLLIIPLCAGVAVVYKTIRCRVISRLPREIVELFFTILIGMALSALALAGVARLMQ
jgi:hypothetical protein